MNTLKLLAKIGGLHEIAEVQTFRGYRNDIEVVVEVYDRGPDEATRYTVVAYDADLAVEDRHAGSPNYTMGNPEGDLETAIMNAHWNQIGHQPR